MRNVEEREKEQCNKTKGMVSCFKEKNEEVAYACTLAFKTIP